MQPLQWRWRLLQPRTVRCLSSNMQRLLLGGSRITPRRIICMQGKPVGPQKLLLSDFLSCQRVLVCTLICALVLLVGRGAERVKPQPECKVPRCGWLACIPDDKGRVSRAAQVQPPHSISASGCPVTMPGWHIPTMMATPAEAKQTHQQANGITADD
jgi:hypothetical protein